MAKNSPLINARCETIQQLPTFRRLLASGRCAIPISGFYEWHKSPPPGKQTLTPYLITQTTTASQTPTAAATVDKNDKPHVTYLAGIYNQQQNSFVIITTSSSQPLNWLHARQPVFLSSDDALCNWLDLSIPVTAAVDALMALAQGSGDEQSPSLIWTRMLKDLSAAAPPMKEMKQKGIASFFSKASSVSSPSKSKSASTPLQNLKPRMEIHKKLTTNASSPSPTKKSRAKTKPAKQFFTKADKNPAK